MNLAASAQHRTPLYDRHVALGGRMVDFGGWELPQQYTSIRDEHLAVRKAAGLFDISHMGRLVVEGGAAEAYLQRLFTNDLSQLAPNHAMYTLMCQEDGGAIDDLVVYREAADRFLVVVNASNREKDIAWMTKHIPAGVSTKDHTGDMSLIAFQGPRAQSLLPRDSSPTDDIPYFAFRPGKVAGVPALVSRTGYTGEDGFELFVDSNRVGDVWDAILAEGKSEGVLPAGLGARDATRLEAALRLYGNDMDETVNPYEAGLGWTVKLGKGDFIGRDALAKVKEKGARRSLVGLVTAPGDIPRHGAAVSHAGSRIGVITSGTHSFFLGHPIALALVEGPSLRVGEKVTIEVRGREAPAEVVKLPFYRGSARSAAAPATS
ncbi:MAG TPA: glycine cleavage system aminomethyltransferase GcvT [Candidatus Dormibacteraeota bacterium]|nr:glycine cleavage system aminomethyltransferase GcvT [Candidatus Dormibacteraeota bacterium]